MANTSDGKCLYEHMKATGKLEYGSVITEVEIHEVLGLHEIEVGTRKEFQDISLAMLTATDYVRNILLGQGKYLTSQNRDYRIVLPSETQKYVENYMSSARGKLNRALKLSRNMPNTDTGHPSSTTGDILFKQEQLRMEQEKQKRLL